MEESEREENNNKTKVLKAVTGNMFKHIIEPTSSTIGKIVNEFFCGVKNIFFMIMERCLFVSCRHNDQKRINLKKYLQG